MASTNRVRLSSVKESAPGVTPVAPRFRLERSTDDRYTSAPNYIDSNELRSDRMTADPILTLLSTGGGGFTFEASYPEANSPEADNYESAFYEVWSNTPAFYNDGTADLVITDAGTTTDTFAVVSGGAAVIQGHLVHSSGFAAPANNIGFFRVASSTATTIVGAGLSLVAETVPPGTAALKVVGFQGVASDISATTTGLTSVALDFTTLGLVPGQFIKIGAQPDASTFAFLVTAGTSARDQAWARITNIAAHALTLDYLPPSWVVDSGAGKAIAIFFGDRIKNGVTQVTMTKEIGFMDQTVPTYIQLKGMTVNTLDHSITEDQVISGTLTFNGQSGGASITSLDPTPDPATINRVMAAHANVGNVSEAGSTLTDPNWARALTFQINNNQRQLRDIASQSPIGTNPGECTVTGQVTTYFGSISLLTKLYTGVVTKISTRWQKDNQAVIFQFPRVTLRGGDPQVPGKNQDVTLPLDFKAALDPLTNAHVLMDRLPYWE